MTWISKLALFPMLGVIVAAGCADSKRSTGGGGSGKTGNAAVDELVSAYCGAVRSCCATAGFPTASLGDCEESFSQIPEFQKVVEGRLLFREPEYAQCRAFVDDLARTCVVPDEQPCRYLYEGTLPEGATCESGDECQDGAYAMACVHPDVDDVLPGTCRPLGRAGVGAPCIDETDHDHHSTGIYTDATDVLPGVCDRRDGLFCDWDTYTCQPIVSAGAGCTFDEGCSDGLYCSGTCVPRKAAGSTCEGSTECEANLGCPEGTCVTRRFTDGDLCLGDYD